MPAYDFLGSGPATGYELDQSFASHPVYLVARDAKDRLTPNETQRNTLIAAGVYVVAIAILWYVLVLCRNGENGNEELIIRFLCGLWGLGMCRICRLLVGF